MKACAARGKACVLETVFNKQCLGLARDRTFVGVATSVDPREAQRKVVEACTKNGGTNCALLIFFCSLWNRTKSCLTESLIAIVPAPFTD